MISVASFEFFAFAIVAVIAFRVLPGTWRVLLVFPLTNITFLWLAIGDFRALIYLLVFLGLAYLGICLAYLRNRWILISVLAVVLFVFCFLKSYQILSFLPYSHNLPVIIGLSYIVIRSLQIMIDLFEGSLDYLPGPWSFVNFVCAWPMLLSGPIQSYQDFTCQIRMMTNDRLDQDNLQYAFTRIVWGVFSIIVLADIAEVAHTYFREIAIGMHSPSLEQLFNIDFKTNSFSHIIHERGLHFILLLIKSFLLGSHLMSPLALGLSAFFYLVFLYFNFAGYTDVMIGVGRLCGLQLPENFNRPWSSKSFLELWSRWHMTLANWFKTYVFNPVVRTLTTRWPIPARIPYYGVAAFFLTFFLVGIWHGPTTSFVLCGIALGLGASVNKLWQLKSRAILGKTLHLRLTSHPIYQTFCSAVTMSFLAMSIVPFWCVTHDIIKLNLVFGIWGQFLAFLTVTLACLPISVVSLHLLDQKTSEMGLKKSKSFQTGALLAAVFIYSFIYPPVDLHFVYQAF